MMQINNTSSQIIMSQAAPSDADSCTDGGPPSGHPPHTDPVPCQGVPTSPEPPSTPLQPLILEAVDLPHSTERAAVEDTSTQNETSEGRGEPQGPEGPGAECDQTLSLEPEADGSEEEKKVCVLIWSLPGSDMIQF